MVGVGEGEKGCLHTPLDGYQAACLFLCMNDYIGEMDGHFSNIYYYYISSVSYHIIYHFKACDSLNESHRHKPQLPYT